MAISWKANHSYRDFFAKKPYVDKYLNFAKSPIVWDTLPVNSSREDERFVLLFII